MVRGGTLDENTILEILHKKCNHNNEVVVHLMVTIVQMPRPHIYVMVRTYTKHCTDKAGSRGVVEK